MGDAGAPRDLPSFAVALRDISADLCRFRFSGERANDLLFRCLSCYSPLAPSPEPTPHHTPSGDPNTPATTSASTTTSATATPTQHGHLKRCHPERCHRPLHRISSPWLQQRKHQMKEVTMTLARSNLTMMSPQRNPHKMMTMLLWMMMALLTTMQQNQHLS